MALNIPGVTERIRDRTSTEGMTPEAIRNLEAAAAAAKAAGLDRIEVVAGKGGGHLSHGKGTEWDIIGYNADGSIWTPDQRVAVAQGARQAGADRFGLYGLTSGLGQGTLHLGQSGPGRPAAVWGAGGKTNGPASRNFTNPAELAFLNGKPLPPLPVSASASPLVPPMPNMRPTPQLPPLPNLRSAPTPPEVIPWQGPMQPWQPEAPKPPEVISWQGPMQPWQPEPPPEVIQWQGPMQPWSDEVAQAPFVDDLGGGMSNPRAFTVVGYGGEGGYSPSESLTIPKGIYGADALVAAAMKGDVAAYQKAMESIQNAAIAANPGLVGEAIGAKFGGKTPMADAVKKQIGDYLATLPQTAPGVVRAVQTSLSNNAEFRGLLDPGQQAALQTAFKSLPGLPTANVPPPNLRPAMPEGPLVANLPTPDMVPPQQQAAFTEPANVGSIKAPPIRMGEVSPAAAKVLGFANPYTSQSFLPPTPQAPLGVMDLYGPGGAFAPSPSSGYEPPATMTPGATPGFNPPSASFPASPATWKPGGAPSSMGSLPAPSLYDPQPAVQPQEPIQFQGPTLGMLDQGPTLGMLDQGPMPPPPPLPNLRPPQPIAQPEQFGVTSGLGNVQGFVPQFGPTSTMQGSYAGPKPNLRPADPIAQPIQFGATSTLAGANYQPPPPPVPPLPNLRPPMPSPAPALTSYAPQPAPSPASMAIAPPPVAPVQAPLGGLIDVTQMAADDPAAAAAMFGYDRPSDEQIMSNPSPIWYDETQFLPDLGYAAYY